MLNLPPYTRWLPRHLRHRKAAYAARKISAKEKQSFSRTAAAGVQRKAKRSRLGNKYDRALYKSAKGYKNPRYKTLCDRADRIQHA